MGYKLTWIYIRPNGTEQKIRPTWPTILSYDFTQSDAWWTPYNRTPNDWDNYRDSDWWYRTATWSDWVIYAPSEIFTPWTPKKITIHAVKNWTQATIWIFQATDLSGDYYSLTDYQDPDHLKVMHNWTITDFSLGSSIMGDITWELAIDTSTTPRTITHTINSSIVITTQLWAFQSIWESNFFWVRLCQWNYWTKAIIFRDITFEY